MTINLVCNDLEFVYVLLLYVRLITFEVSLKFSFLCFIFVLFWAVLYY